jgi:hypothetical protein
MTYRWETPASVWQEDERSGQFELLASEGLGHVDWQAHAPGRLPDVARLLSGRAAQLGLELRRLDGFQGPAAYATAPTGGGSW